MNTTDNKIAEVLAKFGEPMAGNVWRVQGQPVIYHKALERIAAQAQIRFERPQILRAERDEAVILVIGRMGEREEWSIGEATINQNYRVTGKQAAYPFAMAEKRGKDRVILKLIELHGLVYSEEEADELKEQPPEPRPKPQLVPPARKPEAEVKRPWKDVPPPEQAGMMAEKPAFWAFLREWTGNDIETTDDAAQFIRLHCGVRSRADISIGSPAYGLWQDLYAAYAEWRRGVQAEA